ncbi:type 2 lanthipeptide synthetase LanM family protein [Sphaerisporangium sp. NPDC004334]
MSGHGKTSRAAPAGLGPAWWADGLTLAERLDQAGGHLPAGRPPETTGETARWRLREWRDAHGPLDDGRFERRLAAAGLSVEELAALLDEEPAALAGRAGRPAWAGQAAEAVAAADTAPAGEGFTAVVAPFAEGALRHLAGALAECGPAVEAGALLAGWGGELRQRLAALAARTLVLELNVMRVARRLAGETPEERFAGFVRHFRRPEALAALCEEYPVLARLLAETADRFAATRGEMLARFAADRDEIVRTLLGGADPGPLTTAAAGGDTHQGGRSVSVLGFDGGARVVYKPRPQSVHRHFNDALGRLNERVPGLGLTRLAVLDRGAYGWVEFAPHLPCRDQEEVGRYYHRLGALLALLHALDGADFHCENLIACGDQPVLVDLEALLHPVVPGAGFDGLMADPAARALEASVSRSGLLPDLMLGENGVIDLSGMGGDKDATMPVKSPAWAGQGTDEMRLVRDHATFPGVGNRPRVGDDETGAADPADHVEDILAGFGRAYEAIVADAAGLTGLLAVFADDEVRVVPRATRTYGKLMMESTHPDVLRHGLDRDRVLDHLWALSGGDPLRERMTEYETADLWAGDIPIFTTRPGGRDLWTSGGVRLRGVLPESGLSRAVRKIQGMGEADRRRQEWVIRASMASRDRTGLAGVVTGVVTGVASAAPAGGGPADRDRLVAAAQDIADLIDRHACADDGRVNWLGLDLVEDKYWMPRPLSWELYGGYTGVALFLAQCAAVTGRERYAGLARRAVVPLARLAEDPPNQGVMGAFTGLGGVAYALLHLAGLLGEPGLAGPVEDLVEACAKAAGHDEVLDVIGGAAGTLATMLAIHQATGSDAAWRTAEACAERLLTTAIPTGAGMAWRTPMCGDLPLTGFSHGAAGIGWALCRYAEAGGDPRARETALAAFAYESEHYRPDLRGWPDFRTGQGPDDTLHAWCHGAPGIGLSRTSALNPASRTSVLTPASRAPGDLTSASRAFSDLTSAGGVSADPARVDPVRADLGLALAAEAAHGPMANHSLCHGELGNLELLIRTRDRPEVAGLLTARTARVLDDLERHGPRCGAPGPHTPGLMNGLAGIGHGLLRLALPGQIPSVLLFEAPAGKDQR